MKKIKIIFVSLILAIFIISCVAYSFPNLLDYCFIFSNSTASFLALSLMWIYPLSRDKLKKISIPQFLIAGVATIAILVLYVGIAVYFLWHYPLSSITEPIDCFIAIWGVAALTFSTMSGIWCISIKLLKK
jgi:hypothetical protein